MIGADTLVPSPSGYLSKLLASLCVQLVDTFLCSSLVLQHQVQIGFLLTGLLVCSRAAELAT
jgi:hypothetical protein